MKVTIDKDIKTPTQYSKRWMTRWQVFCMIWISIYCGVDVIYNKGENVNNIVVLLISSIIASLIPYFAKSFLETKEDKKMQLENLKLQNSTYSYSFNADINNNSELEYLDIDKKGVG